MEALKQKEEILTQKFCLFFSFRNLQIKNNLYENLYRVFLPENKNR
jgi:hypothetical protein